MQIRLLQIRHFRGFDDATIRPAGHVVVVGEPGAGRTSVADALIRVFSAEATRLPLTDDLDFHDRDRTKRIEVEVTIGDLGDELEQVFFDKLEFWDTEAGDLVDELDDPAELDAEQLEPVVRLCYRAAWSEDEEHALQWVDYPKASDPEAEVFDRVRRADRDAVPFYAPFAAGRPLSLGARSLLRRLIAEAAGDDFAAALRQFTTGLEILADDLGSGEQMSNALEATLDPVRIPLELEDSASSELFRFVPEGGALGSVLRSLSPTVELPRGGGFLPLSRQGSTLVGLFGASELLASAGSSGIVVIDDFGESLDSGGARHLSATLRARAGQLWLTTRHAPVAESFRPSELVRLAYAAAGTRTVHQGRDPLDKPERMAARHFALQLLPAATARAVAVLEGPHDRAALNALSERLLRDDQKALPAAHRVALVDAGAADGSGGASAVPRLAAAARRLGFFAIAVIDGDEDPGVALANADAVVRLPENSAIELAILDGLSESEIAAALRDLDAELPEDLDEHSHAELIRAARKILKQKAGLHAQFLDALPPGRNPGLAQTLIDEIVAAAAERKTGLIQL